MPSLERCAVDGRIERCVVGKSYSGKIVPHAAVLVVVALRMEHLGRNKNPIRKLGQNVRGKTRKIIFYYISGYGRLGISITKAGKAGDG